MKCKIRYLPISTNMPKNTQKLKEYQIPPTEQGGPIIGGPETARTYKNLAKVAVRHEIKRKAAVCEDEAVNAKPQPQKSMIKPVSRT